MPKGSAYAIKEKERKKKKNTSAAHDTTANQAGERQKAYSDDLRKIIIELAKSLPLDDILRLTSCKRRTIERLLSTFRQTGKLRESLKGK